MALQKINVAELSIDTAKLLKELEATKKGIQEIAKENKELAATGKDTSEAFIRNEAELKKLRAEYAQQSKILGVVTNANTELTTAMNKEIRSIDGAVANNKELRQIRNQLNASTEEGAAQIKEINARIDANTDFIKENSSQLEKNKQNVGNYTKSIEAAKIGVRAFGAALKAAGIGLVVAAVAKLTSAFQRNQKVMDFVNTTMTAIGIVFDKVVGSIVDAVSATSKATGGFDALGRILKNMVTLALTPVQVAFHSISAAVTGAQLAWEKSFFGGGDEKKIKELTKELDTTKETLAELGRDALVAGGAIVGDFKEGIGEIGELGKAVASATVEAIKTIDVEQVARQAKAINDAKNNIEGLIIAQERLKLQYQQEAEIQRQLRDDTSLTIAERIAANEKLSEILDKQAQSELAIVDLKIRGAQVEAATNKGNIELQNEVLRLQNERLEVEERITSQRSEQLTNRTALDKEELERIKAFEDQKRELQNSIEIQRAKEGQEREELRLEKEHEKHLAELETLLLNETEKAELLALLEESKEQSLFEIRNKYREEGAKAEEKTEKDRLALKKKTLDGILALTNEETAIGKAALLAKQILALQEIGIEAGLFKAKTTLAAGEAGTDIAKGTAKTASSVPFPFNIPLIAGFIAQTVGIVAAIKSFAGIGGKAKSEVQGFATGGLVSGGYAITRTNGDNRLITARDGEVILNERQQRALGGASTFASIGVPGFATGGQIGSANYNNGGLIDYDVLASKLAQANMMLPAPEVSVREFETTQNRVRTVESLTSL